jgi:hypothetical protein
MSDQWSNPRQHNEVATGFLRTLVAVVVVLGFLCFASLVLGGAVWLMLVAGMYGIGLRLAPFVVWILIVTMVIGALSVIVLLIRWILLPTPERSDATTTPDPPPGEEPR